jgi:hypothetical protein
MSILGKLPAFNRNIFVALTFCGAAACAQPYAFVSNPQGISAVNLARNTIAGRKTISGAGLSGLAIVVLAAAAASAVANAVMLFSLSMVKIVIFVCSLGPRSARLII